MSVQVTSSPGENLEQPHFSSDLTPLNGRQQSKKTRSQTLRSCLRRQLWDDDCTFGAVFGTRDKDSWSQEISGSLGDLGTFLPIIVNLAATGQISLPATFVWAGVYNIITGFSFRIPMCVQPMKAIAAVALAQGLSTAEIMSAGMGTAALVFVIGITGLIDVFNRLFPDALVRGIQLGIGVTLMIKAVKLLPPTWSSWDGYPAAIIVFVFTVAAVRFNSRPVTKGQQTSNRCRGCCSPLFIPAALLLFAIGIIPAAVEFGEMVAEGEASFHFMLYQAEIVSINGSQFLTGFLQGSLAQLPLTTMNSVIALCQISAELFPQKPASPKRVCISIGILNLIGCWFGSMPMCHGAGGLTGQHRFGARSHLSMLILGSAKLLLGVFLGTTLYALLSVYPKSILAILLFQSGLSLAESSALSFWKNLNNIDNTTSDNSSRLDCLGRWHRNLDAKDCVMVFMVTAGASLGFQSSAIALLVGFTAAICVRIIGFVIEKCRNSQAEKDYQPTDEIEA